MKNIRLGFIYILFSIGLNVNAQYKTGEIAFISEGTTVSLDGLVLIPSGAFNLNNKTLSKSINAVKGSSGNSISKNYAFNEAFNFSGSVGIMYLPSELNGNIESALQIAYTAPNVGFKTSSDSQVDGGQHFVSRSFDNEQLLKITAVNANSTLPVTLVLFNAEKSEQYALLKWSTAAEVSSSHFEIQHSVNGGQWSTLGQVKAVSESQSLQEYLFTDINPHAGENLYRLKMVDLDGTFAYSRIVSVQFSSNVAMNVYPNPVTDKLTIESDTWKDIQSLEVYNLVGKMVRKLNNSNAAGDQLKRSFNFQELPTGIYTIKSTLSSGKVDTYKILKK